MTADAAQRAGLNTPIRHQLFIDGRFVDAADGATLATLNPHDNTPIAEVAMAGREDVDRAVAAAQRAFGPWSRMGAADRGRILLKLADVIESNAEDLARLESLDTGHPLRDSRMLDVPRTAACFRYFGGMADKFQGETIPVEAGFLNYTLREPVGVVGQVVPWNFPLMFTSWKMAPALAAGNTVVLKPAEITPLTAMRIAELGVEAGLPEGVFTVLPGQGSVVGQRFVVHPHVRKVCFTGSTEVGKQIMAGCADQVKRVTLELGGKSANIVFADSDLAKAAATAPYAVFDNAGQDCCARSRILVERSAYDEFVGRLETAVRGMKVVDPGQDDSEMGPMVSARQRDSVQAYIDGATVAFQGSAPGGEGFWLPPTVVESTDTAEAVWREEVFGPVVAVMPFDDEEHAVTLANDTEYGLSGSIYTRDLGRALRVSRAVEAGNLSVNSHSSVRYWTPFGGFKQSGLGRELGPDAPNAFTEEKNVFFASD
jgi:acyl-CoA reductase-like NAD-dependent aldehyde dehydrogenase